jgi:hypothetical protein
MRNTQLREWLWFLILGLMSAVLPIPYLFGQATATSGQGLTGSVSDSSGAAIPDADVTIANTATNVEYSARTGGDGYFRFPGLLIGNYRIKVSKAGFETSIREGVTVLAGDSPDVSIRLKVGTTAEQVVVNGDAGTIDKTASFTGETIPKEALQNLPVIANGGTRSPLDYISVFEGVSPIVYNAPGRGGDAGLQWSAIDGVGDGDGFNSLISYKVDGVDQAPAQYQPFGGLFAFPKMPAPEAIQEVRLLTNLDADQGFNLGVVYELITRSGTAQYHGEVYEYARNTAFDASSFLTQSKPPEKQHDFGATFGGPIPFTKKKQFFFVNYQGFRSAYSAQSAILTVPTPRMRTGDFSEILGAQLGVDSNGNPVYQGEIFDPATQRTGANGFVTRDPFPNNKIPTSRLSSVSLFFQNAYPLPNLPGTQNNFATTSLQNNSLQDKLYIKTDHEIGRRQRLSIGFEDFIRNGTAGACGNVLEGPANYIGFSQDVNNCSIASVHARNLRLNYTFSFRPDLLIALNTGFAYDPFGQTLSPQGLTAGTRAGLTGTFTHGTPVVTIAQSTGFGQQQNEYEGYEDIVPVDLSVSWTRNVHQFKFGSQYNNVVFRPIAQSYSNGSFDFDGGGTNQPSFTGGGPSMQPGYGWADFLLGRIDAAMLQSPAETRNFTTQWAWYAMDQWRLNHKLTANYGLRWELFTPARQNPTEWSNFCPSCPNSAAGGLPGAVEFLGDGPGRIGRNTFMNIYPWAVSPRLGIAYAVTQTTVARLYYGITRFPLNILRQNGGTYPNDGFGANINLTTTDGGINPVIPDWDNGTFHPPPLPDLDPTIDNANGIPYYNYKDNISHAEQDFGAAIEHQFPGGWVVTAKYAGKNMRGLSTDNLAGLNQLPVGYLSLGSLLNQDINSPPARAANIPIPYAGFEGSVLQALRPYPQIAGNITVNDALLKNVYWNAAMFDLQGRLFHGLTLLANLTFARSMTNDPLPYDYYGGINQGAPSRQAFSVIPPRMPSANYDDTGGTRPVTANFTFSDELPVGRGKLFGSNMNRVADSVVGGWRVSGILGYGSGAPETMLASTSVATLNLWALRNPSVPIAGNATCASWDPRIGGEYYINPAAFSNPAPFTLGDTLTETARRGCGIANENLSVAKDINLPGEGHKLRIGADAANVLNRHTWEMLQGTVGTSSFGQFAGISQARAVQVHGEIIF